MTPDKDCPSNPASLSGQVDGLIRLVQSGEKVNIQLALCLAKDLGNLAPFQQYLEGLLPLYQLAFESQRQKLDAPALKKLFRLTRLEIGGRELTALPESLGALYHLKKLDCSFNYLQALPESLGRLHYLQRLDCAVNQLRELPESLGGLQNLQILDCNENQLETLPESLAALPALKKLDARNNPLIDIPPALWRKQGLELLLD